MRKGCWGGDWTEKKLNAFAKYVKAYLTIMNVFRDKYAWKLVYFDGFAGSGTRLISNENSLVLNTLFKDDLISKEELMIYKGAAERVLEIEQRGFDYYYFIDKNANSSGKLKKRLSRFENTHTLEFRTTDANLEIDKLASAMNSNKKLKAMVLLDPFGMQVKWDSIHKLGSTSTDLWILVPTGVIVNRLLDKQCKLDHINKLVSFFGLKESDLISHFYKTKTIPSIFGDNIEYVEKVKEPIEKITTLYIKQLSKVFKYVPPVPLVLKNSKNVPIFHFAFASNNKAAFKIASDIIGKEII